MQILTKGLPARYKRYIVKIPCQHMNMGPLSARQRNAIRMAFFWLGLVAQYCMFAVDDLDDKNVRPSIIKT